MLCSPFRYQIFDTGNEMRHNSTLMQRSMASLEWLRTGDRITLELTNTRSLKVLLNSEDMNITFPNVGTVSAGPAITLTDIELIRFANIGCVRGS